IEEEASAFAVAGEAGGEAGVVNNCGEVVEPVDFAGRDVEAEEIVGEAAEGGGAEIFDGTVHLGFGKGSGAPALPGGTAVAGGTGKVDVEDTAIERGALHLGDMLAQEGGVGFIPAEFDESFCLVFRRDGDSNGEQNAGQEDGLKAVPNCHRSFSILWR